jgi:hypothetical protein
MSSGCLSRDEHNQRVQQTEGAQALPHGVSHCILTICSLQMYVIENRDAMPSVTKKCRIIAMSKKYNLLSVLDKKRAVSCQAALKIVYFDKM